jgi:peptide/nickel transport system substrate-binding protein
MNHRLKFLPNSVWFEKVSVYSPMHPTIRSPFPLPLAGFILLALLYTSILADPYQEAPLLAARVAAGDLPPVEERLPDEPLVVKIGSYGVDSIGRYGGVLRRDALETTGIEGATDITVAFYHDLLEDGAFLPLGWKGYEKSADATAWTFYLRRGMKWSDGHPYTVDDFLFWYQDVILHKELTPIPPPWLVPGGKLPSVAKVDDYTIRFTFQTPYLNLPLMLGGASERNFMACPKHYLKNYHSKFVGIEKLKERARREGFTTWLQYFEARRDMLYQSNTDLPTLGPWMLKVGIPDNPAIYVRTPYYWAVDMKGNQLPYIDEMRWNLSGNHDRMKMRMLGGSVTFQRIKELESVELFAQARDKGVIEIGMIDPLANFNGHTAVLNLVTPNPFKARLFNDKRFRHALSLQMPRNEVSEIIYSGQVNPKQIGISDPDHRWYVEDLATAYVETDLEEANRLLDEIGLAERDKNGIRLLPDERPFQINVTTVSSHRYEQATEIVCEHLPRVGIKANLRVISYERLGDALRDAKWEMFVVEDVMNLSFFWPAGMEGARASAWNAYPWYRWLASGGSEGREPPEYMKTSWAWWQKARVAPNEQALKEAIVWLQKNAADELLAIGLTSFTPQIRVKVPNVKNVPFTDPWFLYSAAYFDE